MKILSTRYSNAPYYIISGWKDVFERLGHEWLWWPHSGSSWLGTDKENRPAFDVFDEFEPDIFIGDTNIDRATAKCIAKRPNMKVVLKGRNWGSSDEQIEKYKIDTDAHPIEVASSEEKNRIRNLKELCGKPDFVFNWYHEKRMPETMGDWQIIGVDTLDMQPAANHFVYFPVDSSPRLESDISFIGGFWKYKGININKYLVPLCLPIGKYNIKIFGNQAWAVPQYIGSPSDSIINDILCSAKICPNISGPHANAFGFEVNERVFKIAATKSFCISDHIDSLTKDVFTDNEMPTAKDPEEFFKLIDYYLKEPDLRKEKAEQCYNTVMGSHTYCHRVSKLLSKLNLPDESNRAMQLLEK